MSSRWLALGDDWRLSWSDAEPYLTGTPDKVVAVLRELYKNDDVMVTVTGPALPAEVDSGEAVAIIVSRLFPDARWVDFPDLTKLWDKDIPNGVQF